MRIVSHVVSYWLVFATGGLTSWTYFFTVPVETIFNIVLLLNWHIVKRNLRCVRFLLVSLLMQRQILSFLFDNLWRTWIWIHRGLMIIINLRTASILTLHINFWLTLVSVLNRTAIEILNLNTLGHTLFILNSALRTIVHRVMSIYSSTNWSICHHIVSILSVHTATNAWFKNLIPWILYLIWILVLLIDNILLKFQILCIFNRNLLSYMSWLLTHIRIIVIPR
jgi:hypothetical protein